MSLPDFPPDDLKAWLTDAPRELILMILERMLSKGDRAWIRQIVQEAWVAFLKSPDRRQHREICDAVADLLRRRFQLAEADAVRLAVELVGSATDPGDQSIRTNTPLPVVDWQRVHDSVLSIDVQYQTTEPGSRSTWRRHTGMYLRDASGPVRNVSQEVDLRWEDLPNDVREACIQRNLFQQRFVLYGGDASTT